MFAKILTIILACGAIGCVLLVNRQQRIEAAHEMSVIHNRLAEHERSVWRLRAEIARLCRPEQIRDAIERLGDGWQPMVLRREGPAGSNARNLAERSDARDQRRPNEEAVGG